MKHILWILAWALVPVVVSENSEDTTVTNEASEDEKGRSKRQLNFDGGGGGVNRYVNGDDDFGDYEYYDTQSREYWADERKVSLILKHYDKTRGLHFWDNLN